MAAPVYKFGVYRLDANRFELTRETLSIKLERKPMELLLLLAEGRGRLVTREEIAERLWKGEVFVDTEHGINTAIRKIRAALRDDSDDPKFVLTVTGMGYRFVAKVEKEYPEPSKSQAAIPELVKASPAEMDAAALPATAAPAPPNDKPVEVQREQDAQTARGPRRWIALTAAAAILLTGALAFIGPKRWLHPGEPAINSIAVLPLDNLSGDANQDYFAVGMTDELTTMLAKDSTLRVISRTSAMQYKGAHRPLKEIARALNVDAVVEGSVERAGDHVHMNLQLIRAETDTHLWADSFDRDENDVSTMPDEVAREIAQRLKRAAATRAPAAYIKPEAHDAYLRGQYYWTMANNDEAGRYFQKAVDSQPDYAAGWAGLSEFLIVKAMSGRGNTPDLLVAAETAARKAVALDDSQVLAHNSLGAVLFFGHWDTVNSIKELDRALELEPENSQVLHLKAKFLCAMGHFDEANAVQALSSAANPYAHPGARAEVYNCTREFERAKQEGLLRLEGFPRSEDVLQELASSYFWTGHEKESVEYQAREFTAEGAEALGTAIRRDYKTGGYRAVLRDELAALIANQNFGATPSALFFSKGGSPVLIARTYAMLGEKDEAIKYLNQAANSHSPELVFFMNNPCFDSLHNDARFQAIAKRMGLPYEGRSVATQ